jgi:hypothetical protein
VQLLVLDLQRLRDLDVHDHSSWLNPMSLRKGSATTDRRQIRRLVNASIDRLGRC